jgi:hypothetical protein
MVVEHEVFDRVNMDKNSEDMPMLHCTRPGKVQLSIKSRIAKPAREREVDYLRQAARVAAESPTNIIA